MKSNFIFIVFLFISKFVYAISFDDACAAIKAIKTESSVKVCRYNHTNFNVSVHEEKDGYLFITGYINKTVAIDDVLKIVEKSATLFESNISNNFIESIKSSKPGQRFAMRSGNNYIVFRSAYKNSEYSGFVVYPAFDKTRKNSLLCRATGGCNNFPDTILVEEKSK